MRRVVSAVRVAVALCATFAPSVALAEDTCTRRTGTLYVERECGGIQAVEWVRYDCSESGAHVYVTGSTWDVRPNCQRYAE